MERNPVLGGGGAEMTQDLQRGFLAIQQTNPRSHELWVSAIPGALVTSPNSCPQCSSRAAPAT